MNERRNIYFFYKSEPQIDNRVQLLIEMAIQHEFSVVNNIKDANIVVAIGGDGAFLQAVRQTGFREDCLYTGITSKSLPSLYCDFIIDDAEKMIEAMTTEQIEVRRYPTIKVLLDGETEFYCLNECSIRSAIIKTFVMDVHIDGVHFERFRGDGIVVSTPTGSTGYNKSVKGAVVDPMLPCYQVSEVGSLNNNKYRTLGSPFILSGNRELVLSIVQDGNDYPIIGMDNEALSSRHIQQLKINLSERIIKTVKLKNNSFWEKVNRTFL